MTNLGVDKRSWSGARLKLAWQAIVLVAASTWVGCAGMNPTPPEREAEVEDLLSRLYRARPDLDRS